MSDLPDTSVSLIKAISTDYASGRWEEFYALYSGAMRDFVSVRFPALDPDDILQESMLALSKSLAGYRYSPEDRGRFRNYLIGIVKHKALDELSRRSKESSFRERMAQDGAADQAATPPPFAEDESEDAFRKAALEVAISQLMSDDTITPRTREVFRHVALMQENPAAVAERFGITRNNVDQIKKRLTLRLGEMLARLTDC